MNVWKLAVFLMGFWGAYNSQRLVGPAIAPERAVEVEREVQEFAAAPAAP